MRLRVLRGRPRLHARPRPSRRPRTAHPARRRQGRLARGAGPARARGDSRQHADLAGLRWPGETAGGAQGARCPGGGAARRAAGAEPCQRRTDPQRGGGGGSRERPKRPALGAGPGTAEVLHPPRDPAQLAAFINLRVLDPEHAHWRRGIEAAVIYHRLRGDLRVPFTYRVPGRDEKAVEAEGWPATLSAFPLGQWIADARRFYARGDMDPDRIAQLEKLGMVWSHYDVAWEEGLAAARGWAAENGHLAAPTDATYKGYRVGLFLKNARASARRAAVNEHRRAEGLPVHSAASALPEERREQLDDIDPAWCPAWPIDWQRCFHLPRQHLEAGGALPTPGDVVHKGEDLGRWVRSVRLGWDSLTSVQQWMCEHILGIEPAGDDEKPKPRMSQADKWAMNYAAAKQYYEREGHLLRLGAWISNQRSRAATLTPERIEQLSNIGMRWT
ncbi:helicase associated domain-containing protein [Streptomyces cinerochromogenes]|uniref:Helicase associated domain-containing protein n=1 Tax=Streptomyces cinerochromogenes TaxID=66422 RepID=A0ABW7BJY1_9ACTN